MAKFVPDVKTQRWIVISTNRVNRMKHSIPGQQPPPPGVKIDPFAEWLERCRQLPPAQL